MKREIYEFNHTDEKLRHMKQGIIIETDINNYSKIQFGAIFYYDNSDGDAPTINSNIKLIVCKVEKIEDIVNLLQPYYPNLVKENLKLLSSVKWTDWNYSPTEENKQSLMQDFKSIFKK